MTVSQFISTPQQTLYHGKNNGTANTMRLNIIALTLTAIAPLAFAATPGTQLPQPYAYITWLSHGKAIWDMTKGQRLGQHAT
jgi:hypothetical protein